MNNQTQLFIRACRSKDPHTRVKSVFKRYYLNDGEACTKHLIVVLSEICDKYQPFKTLGLLSALDPNGPWYFTRDGEQKPTYHQACLHVLVNRIRIAPNADFQGLSTPLKYKNV